MGLLGWLRWTWRQLTSMRTALLLLFLLAIAAVPGSVFPQRGVDNVGVREYIADNPTLGPFLDRLSMFDVFGAPWFAAVYVLLFVSLAGCVLPRAWVHLQEMRARPPRTPRRLERLAHSRSAVVEATPDEAAEQARAALRRKRYRVDVDAGGVDGAAVAAEKGYLRETGNLVFHLSLLLVLVGVAMGSTLGFRGNVIVREDTGFSNVMTQYDSFEPGRFFSASDLTPFSFRLKDFTATFQDGGKSHGAATSFNSVLEVTDRPGAEPRTVEVSPNNPLNVDGTKVFLVGHGYAPDITVRDGDGEVVYSDTVPFLPQDGAFSSTGVVKAADARPTQIGLQGIFLPTASIDPELGPISTFPRADDPALFLSAWTGDLGLDGGVPQSVYRLYTEDMERVGIKSLRPGESWELPDGAGTVEFNGYVQFATFAVAHDPGKWIALAAVGTALAGLVLSLTVRRRRLWVRASAQEDGRTLVVVGGLGRTRASGADIDAEVDELLAALGVVEQDGSPAAPDDEPVPEEERMPS